MKRSDRLIPHQAWELVTVGFSRARGLWKCSTFHSPPALFVFFVLFCFLNGDLAYSGLGATLQSTEQFEYVAEDE